MLQISFLDFSSLTPRPKGDKSTYCKTGNIYLPNLMNNNILSF